MNVKSAIFSLLLLGLTGLGHAGIFDSVADRNVSVSYAIEVGSGTAAAGTSTRTVVIHLSSTATNGGAWKHTNNREINITGIRYQIDKVATSTGAIRLGVVTRVSPSSGTVSWFWHKNFEKNVSNTGDEYNGFDPVFYRTRVEKGVDGTYNGTTPYMFNNESTTSTVFTTTAAINSPDGFTTTGAGDIVMEAVNRDQLNYYKLNLSILYHTPETR